MAALLVVLPTPPLPEVTTMIFANVWLLQLSFDETTPRGGDSLIRYWLLCWHIEVCPRHLLNERQLLAPIL
jgi:hypothetical protein